MKLNKIQRKKYRVRNKLKSVASNDRFRLCLSRSTRNISAQIIDDVKNITLVAATSNKKEIRLVCVSSRTTCRKSKRKEYY